jgi:hypothetical protein
VDFQRRTLLAIVVSVLIWIVYANFLAPPMPEPKAKPAELTTEAKARQRTPRRRPTRRPEAKPITEACGQTHRLDGSHRARGRQRRRHVRRTELLSKQFQHADGRATTSCAARSRCASASTPTRPTSACLACAGWEVVGKSDTSVEPALQGSRRRGARRSEADRRLRGPAQVKVLNRSSKRQSHRMLLKSQYGLPKEASSYDVHRGLCATADDVEEFASSDVSEQSGTIRGQIRWAGLDSKYFLSAVVPTHPVQMCEVRLSDDGAAGQHDRVERGHARAERVADLRVRAVLGHQGDGAPRALRGGPGRAP